MPKFLQNIIIVSLSFVIFFTGIGTTVFNFCCNNCIENLFDHKNCKADSKEAIVSCCKHEATYHCEENKAYAEKECCSAQRYSIDLDSFHFQPVVFSPFVWLNTIYLQLKNSLSDEFVISHFSEQLKIPPNMHPRAYLSLIRILII